MLDLMKLYTTQRKQYACWSGQISHRVGSQGRSAMFLGNEELSFVVEFRYIGHIMTADCRDDKDIKKTIQEEKCSWQYAGQEVLICTY